MPTEPFHRLFFAVRPPKGVIPEIAERRESLGHAKGPVADEHLHLTTWLFEDSQDFPADAAERAQAAVAATELVRFRIVLGRMVGGKGHVVLVPSEPLPGFVAFQEKLDRALRTAGLRARPDWRFSPHVTLLHGRHEVDQGIVPIGWEVEEVFLLDSIVGERRHEIVARWPLAPKD